MKQAHTSNAQTSVSVRDFDEKTRQDKQINTIFETMERFLDLKYLLLEYSFKHEKAFVILL